MATSFALAGGADAHVGDVVRGCGERLLLPTSHAGHDAGAPDEVGKFRSVVHHCVVAEQLAQLLGLVAVEVPGVAVQQIGDGRPIIGIQGSTGGVVVGSDSSSVPV